MIASHKFPDIPKATAGLGLLLLLYFLKQVTDYDVWFHLVVGRETLAAGIPDRGFYVIPLLGEPERFYEWGYGTLLYLLHQAGGIPALNLFNAAVGALTVTLLVLTGRGRDWRSLASGAIAALIVAATLDFRLVLRPEIMLFLAMAGTLFVLERHRDGADPRWLLVLPALGLILANLHPSVIFLLAITGCYAVDALVSGQRARARQLVLVLPAMALAACLNPHGIHQIILPFRFAQDTRLLDLVAEFLPVLQSRAAPWFFLLLALALPALARKRTRRWVDVLLVGIFAVAAFRYARNLGLLAIVCFMPMRTTLHELLSLAAKAPISAPILRHFVLALLVAGATGLAAHRANQGDWGLGIQQARFPSLAGKIARDPHAARFATLFLYGGYLAWQTGKPVLADGRNYGYNEAIDAHNHLFSGKPGWDQLLDRYRIDVIFTPALQPGGRPVPLLANLYFSEEWELGAEDNAGLWFARKGIIPPGRALDKDVMWRRLLADYAARGKNDLEHDPVLQLARRQSGAPNRQLK